MRMGIVFTWFSMSSPTSMSDTSSPSNINANFSMQVSDTTDRLDQTRSFPCCYKNSSRVITSVFQLFQALHQDISCVAISDNSDNSTHNITSDFLYFRNQPFLLKIGIVFLESKNSNKASIHTVFWFVKCKIGIVFFKKSMLSFSYSKTAP